MFNTEFPLLGGTLHSVVLGVGSHANIEFGFECGYSSISIESICVSKLALCESVRKGYSCPWYHICSVDVRIYGSCVVYWDIYV